MDDYFRKTKSEQIQIFASLRAFVNQGRTLGELVDVDESAWQNIFETAVNLYKAKKYHDAAMHCANYLLLNHRNDKAWELLGLNLVQLKNYTVAKMAFYQAMLLNIRNPVYGFYLAQTIEADEGLEKALPAYHTALELCHHTTGDKEIKAHIVKKLERAR